MKSDVQIQIPDAHNFASRQEVEVAGGAFSTSAFDFKKRPQIGKDTLIEQKNSFTN